MTKRTVKQEPATERNDTGVPDRHRAQEAKAAPVKVVAITDQMEAAKQDLYSAARSETPIPVPDVMIRALGDTTNDTLLSVWRAWDIYATHGTDGWMTRADRVR